MHGERGWLRDVSWSTSTRTTNCTAPGFPRKATGGRAPSITVGSGHPALERSLEMMRGACLAAGTAGSAAPRPQRVPARAPEAQDFAEPTSSKLLSPRQDGP